jgi:hypothetical protein
METELLEKPAERTITYNASPTLSRFHQSNAFFRGIMGPVGSGKSTACCMEVMSRALRQAPAPDGKRHTRFVVVRNTYRELEDTTLKTWLDWFPADVFGQFTGRSMAHNLQFKDVECEVLFRALDRPDDVKKLLSLELTGAWVNEAREVPKSIIDTLCDRVGRYPSMREGGCSWRGVFADTNPPDDDHWWYRLSEDQAGKVPGWEFFKQPGGLIERGGKFEPNPAAENTENLEKDYYMTRAAGKDPDHCRVYYCSQYGFVRDGKPVVPEYIDAVHCSSVPLEPVPDIPIMIGLDFGLTPAAIFGQRLPDGRWQWFHELVSEDMGIRRFSELLILEIQQNFRGFPFENIFGDPAGEQRAQTDETTPFQILNNELQAAGLPIQAYPAPSNDFTIRRESLAKALSRLVDGKPGLIISPTMKITRKGLSGGYCYRRIQVSGDAKYWDKPDKNKYSHPVEAGEYMLVGAGEGYSLISSASNRLSRPIRSKIAIY